MEKYDLIKVSYSKDELEDIYQKITDDYENQKELDGKEKVYIKTNSFY